MKMLPVILLGLAALLIGWAPVSACPPAQLSFAPSYDAGCVCPAPAPAPMPCPPAATFQRSFVQRDVVSYAPVIQAAPVFVQRAPAYSAPVFRAPAYGVDCGVGALPVGHVGRGVHRERHVSRDRVR